MKFNSLFLVSLVFFWGSACVQFQKYGSEPSSEVPKNTETSTDEGDAGSKPGVEVRSETKPEPGPEPTQDIDAGTPGKETNPPDEPRIQDNKIPENPPLPEKTPEKVKETKPPPTQPPPLDLKRVQWLHTNVSGWKETSKLKSVTFTSSMICLNHTHAAKWTTSTAGMSVKVAANPWVFIWNAQRKRWYGATWEWMRPGQTCKARTSVAGDHIKVSPYDARSGWRPKKGEILYFMVSGLARNSHRNQKERSNFVKVVWP